MNVTVATPQDGDRPERRRCTHAGVTALTIALRDGTQIEIAEEGEDGITITSERLFSAVLHDDNEEDR